jgi:hypothetical protein
MYIFWRFVFKTEIHETVNLVTAISAECGETYDVLYELMVALTFFPILSYFPFAPNVLIDWYRGYCRVVSALAESISTYFCTVDMHSGLLL